MKFRKNATQHGLFLWTFKVARTKATNRNHRQHWHNHQIIAYNLYHSPMNLHSKIVMSMFIPFLPFRPKNIKKKHQKVCVSDPQLWPEKRSTNNLDRASAGPPKSPETPDAKTVDAWGGPGLNCSALKSHHKKHHKSGFREEILEISGNHTNTTKK